MRACKIAVMLLVGFLVPHETPAVQSREPNRVDSHVGSAGRKFREEMIAFRFKCRRRQWPPCQAVPIVQACQLKEPAVDLRWKLKVSQPFYQEISTRTSQEMKVMGMAVNQSQEQTYYLRWTPEKLDDQGNWTLGMKILGIKMLIDIGGNRLTTYGSTQPNPLADLFKEVIGVELKMNLAKGMTIARVVGTEDLIARLAKVNPQMEPLLKSMLSDSALRQMPNPLFEFVPGMPVRKGDSWTRKTEANLGPLGQHVATNKYTYEGRKGGLDQIKVESSKAYTVPKDKGKLPFTIVAADLKGPPMTGLILFDRAKGRVVSGVFRSRLEGGMKMDIGGMSVAVELTQAQEVHVRVTDEDPLKKQRRAAEDQ